MDYVYCMKDATTLQLIQVNKNGNRNTIFPIKMVLSGFYPLSNITIQPIEMSLMIKFNKRAILCELCNKKNAQYERRMRL